MRDKKKIDSNCARVRRISNIEDLKVIGSKKDKSDCTPYMLNIRGHFARDASYKSNVTAVVESNRCDTN